MKPLRTGKRSRSEYISYGMPRSEEPEECHIQRTIEQKIANGEKPPFTIMISCPCPKCNRIKL